MPENTGIHNVGRALPAGPFMAGSARPTFKIFAAMVVLLGLSAGVAKAEETGISVTGVGTAKVKPDAVELSGVVSGEAELAADADVKFKDARKKAVDLFEAMKIPGLTVTGGGASVHDHMDAAAQMRAMQGNGTGDIKNKVQVAEKLKITITGIDQMPPEKVQAMVVKVLDAARQSGLQIGPPPPTNYYQYQQFGNGNDSLITYKVADPAAARADAYKAAVADAKSKADQLATLSGGKLGKVVSVSEEATPQNPYYQQFQQNNESDDDIKSVGTASTGDVTIVVRLAMKFELAQ
jgi:uncharacterized protein YggE